MSRKSQRDDNVQDMYFRSLSLRADTFSEESRSVEATISTDKPVLMPDYSRGAMIPEVLVPSGAEYPGNRQVPFLDSHQRRSVKDQLGSAREIKVNSDGIDAKLVFRKAKEAEDALGGVRDGHITDVSVGYDVLKRTYVPDGEKRTIGSRTYAGPVNVVTKWRLREVSLTPIGADDQAKLRGLDPAAVRFQTLEKEDFTMNAELRALLVSKGMPEAHTDEQAQRWLIDNAAKLASQPAEKPTERSQQTLPTAADIAKLVADATRAAIVEQEAARKKFDTDVRELCELAEVPGEVDACRGLESLEAVRAHIKTAKAKQAESIPYGGSVRVLSHGADRLKTDIRAALVARAAYSALNGDSAKLEKYLPSEEARKADAFRHATLFDMASEFVRAMGVQTLGLTRDQIAICAMFGPDKAGIRAAGAAYHNTGSFANITLDAINKSMMIGYSEVPATWRGPMKQGQSATDFKNIHRTQIGAVPNLPVWNDTDRPEMASMADAKETYAVEARSIGIDFGYKLIVNDDMSALTGTPMKLGDAAARTVNAVAWSQVTSNPTMRDGIALFSAASGARKRSNLTTGAGTPTVANVGTLKALMRQMRGENTPEGNESPDILNLTPSYLVVPSTLETVAEQLVNSIYDPANANNAFNPARTLTPVVEPILDAASATAWYLFASPTRIETVEVTFLAGQETPQVRTVMDEHTLATTYYVLQSVAAKALDHRGVQRHNGA
jgi:HK97 family phage prohead protease